MHPYTFTPQGGSEFFFRSAGELTVMRPRRQGRVQVAGAHGSFNTNGDVSPRNDGPVTLAFPLVYPTQDRLDDLALAFAKRGTLRVVADDGTLRQTTFTPDDDAVEYTWRTGNTYNVSVTGVLAPFWRSERLRAQTISSSPTIVTTNGNADVYDTLTIVFTASGSGATGFTLTNSTNGYSIAWAGTLSAGQTLTISVPALTFTKTGAVDQWSAMTFGANQVGPFKLAAGANTITYSLTGAGSFALSWRDTWL